MITLRQGKTLLLELHVVDTEMNPIELSGAQAYMAYTLSGSEITTIVSATINGNVVSVGLSSEDTAELMGNYDLEVKLKDASGNVDDIYADRLKVLKSVLPVFPS